MFIVHAADENKQANSTTMSPKKVNKAEELTYLSTSIGIWFIPCLF
jgi:hypothetical protein